MSDHEIPEPRVQPAPRREPATGVVLLHETLTYNATLLRTILDETERLLSKMPSSGTPSAPRGGSTGIG